MPVESQHGRTCTKGGQRWSALSFVLPAQVYICCRGSRFQGHERTWENTDVPTGPRNDIWQRQLVANQGSDESVTFADGPRLDHVDTVVYAIEYEYWFLFLQDVPGFEVKNNRYVPCRCYCAMIYA